jgi:hypothetical protein
MADSILNTTKKILGFDEDDTSFDLDILTHINSAFDTLEQLGIGPAEGFSIEDAVPTWDDYLQGDPKFNSVRTYVFLKVRFLFDPPTTSFHLQAMKDQIEQFEWRLNAKREETKWVPGVPTPPVTEPEVIVVPSNRAWYSE